MNNATAWIITTAVYVILIVSIMLIASKKIRKLQLQLIDHFPNTTISTVQELLYRMRKELTKGDLRILINRANQLPIVLRNGEFSYMEGLDKILFTPNQTTNG